MLNVFDLVADFYNQDEEWNMLLHQDNAEAFLRMRSWQGAGNDALIKEWNHLTMLCLYLGHADIYLGDMGGEDFIDCIAWCGRNISEFSLTAADVGRFLDTMEALYGFLCQKKIISRPEAPGEARKAIMPDGKLLLLNEAGEFLPRYNKYNFYDNEDLPSKVFLNIGDTMRDLYEALKAYFENARFHRDLERAAFLYSGPLLSGIVSESPDTEGYTQCFWDYFFFDYYMIETDKKPLQYFCEDAAVFESMQPALNRDIAKELLSARLVLFYVVGVKEEGVYLCRDFLTGELYNLLLPIEDLEEIGSFLFLGHIFYNESLVMNFVRAIKIFKSARKKLYDVLNRARKWVAVRTGGELAWAAFTDRFPMFLRHAVLIYSACIRLEGFNYTTEVAGYHPSVPDAEDAVVRVIRRMMQPYAFTAADIMLAQTMWADFQKLSGRKVRLADVWAAGVIRNFIMLNGVYKYDLPQISEICHNIPVNIIEKAAAKIKQALRLEKQDPRYINEQGLLLMLLT